MILTERHVVKGILKKDIDKLMFLSKNLYNLTLYNIRQHYFNTQKLLSYIDIYYIMRDTPCYRELPDKVAKQTIKKLYDNLNSNFKAINSYKKNPSKFKGKPKLPQYLDIIEGRFMVIYEKGAINRKEYKKNKTIKLSKTNIVIKPTIDLKYIKEIHLTKLNNSFVINIIYDKKVKKMKERKEKKYAGIDLGINNLITLTFEHSDRPIIYNGKTIKSINQGWNKRNAELKSLLPKDVKSSKKIRKEIDKRNFRIKDCLHKVSSNLVNQLVSKSVTDVVIGYNKGLKQDIENGKIFNQKFINIPYLTLIDMIKYKCQLNNINVIITEESYTSKTSFIDNEPIKFHETYKGNRKYRGLFISEKGVKINADVNASYNIIRKVIPTFIYDEGIVALNPIKLII